MRLILASSSPRRRELIAALGYEFEVMVPLGVDEDAAGGLADHVCRELARQKAEWVLSELDDQEGCVVIGCDTLVALVHGGQERILGKPGDTSDATRMLRMLSGLTHRVLSAVAVARPNEPTRVEVEVSHVTFKKLDDTTIDTYVQSGDPLDKAGAYGIQSAGEQLVDSIRGCYLNIVGLPLALLSRLLGIDPAYACECRIHALQRGTTGCEILTDELGNERLDIEIR